MRAPGVIPRADLDRAREYVRDKGWVEGRTEAELAAYDRGLEDGALSERTRLEVGVSPGEGYSLAEARGFTDEDFQRALEIVHSEEFYDGPDSTPRVRAIFSALESRAGEGSTDESKAARLAGMMMAFAITAVEADRLAEERGET